MLPVLQPTSCPRKNLQGHQDWLQQQGRDKSRRIVDPLKGLKRTQAPRAPMQDKTQVPRHRREPARTKQLRTGRWTVHLVRQPHMPLACTLWRRSSWPRAATRATAHGRRQTQT
eukprot:UN4670